MTEPHTADLGTRYRYRQEGAALERKRIIELLEPLAKHNYNCDVGCYRDECSAGYFEHAISLIEWEEQK